MQKLNRNYLIWIASVRAAHSESTHATMAKCLRCDRIRHSWMPAHNDMGPRICPRLADNGRGPAQGPLCEMKDTRRNSNYLNTGGQRMKFCTCKASSNPNQANLSFGASDCQRPMNSSTLIEYKHKHKNLLHDHIFEWPTRILPNQEPGDSRHIPRSKYSRIAEKKSKWPSFFLKFCSILAMMVATQRASWIRCMCARWIFAKFF